MGKPKVTVVGSNMVDLITYIDRMPHEGETIVAPRFEMGFGGKGANQAVAAALLGAHVSMVTCIGDDMFGPNTKKNFERLGIDTRFVRTVPGVSSGVAPIFVDPYSKNSILIIKGANERLAPSHIDEAADLISASDVVVMQLEISLETVYHTMELCAKHHVPVILNPAPADPNLNISRVANAEFFVPNETELKTLTAMPTSTIDEIKAAARSLIEQGLSKIIVTLGDKGCLFVTKDKDVLIPARRVKSVDTTGAGDAFIGCFATYFLEMNDVSKAIEFANAYAAFSTMKPGTQKSFLNRKEFESMLS
jgi:ribokinase